MANVGPLISVVIPAYNSEQTLARAVDSIRSQSHANLDIIIVVDRSTDDTRLIADACAARDPRIRVCQGPDDPNRYDERLKRNINAGWSARNLGVSEARGEYVTFQDADDVSLVNRIEIQLALLKKHDATHLTVDCRSFDAALVGTRYEGPLPAPALGPGEIFARARQAKGIVAKLSPALNSTIPFHAKRLRIVNNLFFGTLESYPGAGNSPLFHRSVIDKVRFRPLTERVWPSFMGRGADRDFNFQVAETFKNSYYFDIPLYLWSRL